jgi:origin recognition complex subunit 2
MDSSPSTSVSHSPSPGHTAERTDLNTEASATSETVLKTLNEEKANDFRPERRPRRSSTTATQTKDHREAFEAEEERHPKEKQRLLREYQKSYRYWHCQLTEGFNLLFYGVGSKKSLLEDFATKTFTDGPTVVINGYCPNLSIQTVLETITGRVLRLPLRLTEISEFMECIQTIFQTVADERKSSDAVVVPRVSFTERRERLHQSSRLPPSLLRVLEVPRAMYLLIHNIDVLAGRLPHTQRVFASLAAIHQIHIVASLDHHLTPLLWDNRLLSQFRWIYHHVPTFMMYQHETSYEGQLSETFTSRGTLGERRGALYVLRTLPPKTAQIYAVLARFILQHPQALGLSADEYYEICSQKFLVTSRTIFNSTLGEFKDHQLIRLKRGSDGQLYYTVPLHPNILKQVLEEFGPQFE